jgi:hypothetical protein
MKEMAKSLQAAIAALASQFANDLLAALRNASLEEVSQVTADAQRSGGGRGPRRTEPAALPKGRRTKSGRLSRRTADDIGTMVANIVSLLDRHPEGMRAEQIRTALGVEPRELPRPLAEALSSRKVSKAGQKRATTYFAKAHAPAGGKLPPAQKTAKAKKRPSSKRGKKREESAPGATLP